MANTKSKSKTTKKKGSTFSRINFGSTKTRIIVTLLVFGVIGGGLLVYRSYAATQNQWNYNVSSGTLKITSKLRGSEPVKETVKNSKLVAQLDTGDKVTVVQPGTIFPAVPAGQSMRLCVVTNTPNPLLRASQKDTSGRDRYFGDASATSNTTFSRNEVESVGNGYYLACTYKRTREYTLAGAITIINTGPTTRVSEVLIRFIDGTTTGTVKNW